MDKNTLAHTKWNCKYHIVFAPKYRRKVIYGKIKVDIGKILRKLCEQKGGRNYRSESMPRSHPYAGEHSTEDEYLQLCRLPEREEFSDDF